MSTAASEFPQPSIGVLPYGFKPKGRLADVPLSDLLWPLGAPDNVDTAKVGDLGEHDHVAGFAELWMYGQRLRGTRAGFSIVIAEPRPIHWYHLGLTRLFAKRFQHVLTSDKWLLDSISNAHNFVYGDAWIQHWRSIDTTKTSMLSVIASKKRRLRGHRLRHMAVDWLRRNCIDAGIFGRAYAKLEDKADGLARYRYSIVIENTRQPGYITEKIIDALLMRCVPIYWGAPDIDTYFDAGSIIQCTSFEEITAAVASLSEVDCAARSDAIEINRKSAALFADPYRSVVRILQKVHEGRS